MKKFIAALVLLVPFVASAQNAKVLTGSALQKLSVFIGTWKSTNTTPGGPDISAISTITLSANGQYIIADQVVNNAGNKMNNLSIYSYNAPTDSYKLSLVGIPGMAPFVIPITYSGDVLIYTGNTYIQNGKKVYGRTLNTFISPDYYTYQVQSSADSIHWTTSMEGKSEKIKPGQ